MTVISLTLIYQKEIHWFLRGSFLPQIRRFFLFRRTKQLHNLSRQRGYDCLVRRNDNQ